MIAVTRRLPFAAVVLVAVCAVLVTTSVRSADAASYKTCTLNESDQYPHGGVPTYTLALKQRGTSCSTAKRVMRAFYKCRPKTGVRCTSKVLTHFSCTGRKLSTSPAQFDATYTCTWGKRRVNGNYTQNT